MSWLSKTVNKATSHIGGWFNDVTGVTQQNEYNLQMWKMQNEYNSPAKQMERYREAGLNPNLIYGNGSSSAGNATSAPSMESYSSGFSKFMNFWSNLYSLKNLKAQNNNLNAQTDSIKADTALKNKNVELKDKELGLKSRELDILERTGMHPGVGSTIMGIGSAVAEGLTGKSESPTERAKGVAQSVKNAYDAGFPSFVDKSSDRGVRMAVQVADKKNLSGKERVNFIRKFVEIYDKTH